jgi:hypothetical protein
MKRASQNCGGATNLALLAALTLSLLAAGCLQVIERS